tara:strand:+ start:200 stop:571 length:372 start_codon:yes stop_codon:yes gene_type:complete
MKYDIKNRFTDKVQFTAEIDCREDALEAVKVGMAVRWAVKTGADLRGADLQDANLRYTDLRYTDLQGANLQGANLQGGNLQYVNLRGANLQDANIRYTDLQGANFEQGDKIVVETIAIEVFLK